MSKGQEMLDILSKMGSQSSEIIKNEIERPDFHTMALLAAQTIPSSSLQELLSNAERIEWWLNEPKRQSDEFRSKLS